MPPFSPLSAGQAVVAVAAEVISFSIALAGDISDIDQAAVTAALRIQTSCYDPCVLTCTFTSGSVNVETQLTVPETEAETLATVAASATTLVTAPASVIGAAVGATVTGVTAAADPTTGQIAMQARQVAFVVAPPPPSPPPYPPSPPSPPTPPTLPPYVALSRTMASANQPTAEAAAEEEDNTGMIIGVIVGVVVLGAIGAFVMMKSKSKNKVSPVA